MLPSLKPASYNFCCIANLLSSPRFFTCTVRHITCPPSLNPSHHMDYTPLDAPFSPNLALSFSLSILPIVSPPIPLCSSQWPPSREIHHSNLAEAANTAKQESTRTQCAHTRAHTRIHIYVQSNREKQDSDEHRTAEMGRIGGLQSFILLSSDNVLLSNN